MNDNPNWKPPTHENRDTAETIMFLAELSDRLLVLLENRDANNIRGDDHAREMEERRIQANLDSVRYLQAALDRLGEVAMAYFRAPEQTDKPCDVSCPQAPSCKCFGIADAGRPLESLSDVELSEALRATAAEHQRVFHEVGKRLDAIQGGIDAPK